MGSTVAGLSVARLGRIAERLERDYVEPGKIAGAQVLVARHGRVAYAASLGLMDRERGRPWGDDTLVRIYSMTKPIVSIALMSLWERGLFQLDDPVRKVLPEWRDQKVWVSGAGEQMVVERPARPISFRDILSHTAGLTYGGLLDNVGIPGGVHPVDEAYKALRVRGEADEDLDLFVAKLGNVPLRYQPGQRWMYSLATDVAGALVQRLSGRPLDRFLDEEVFQPLGMVDTAFRVAADKRDRFAACYSVEGRRTVLSDDPATSAYLAAPVFLSGGGGLVSTMADYHRFCEMLRRGGELDGARIIGPRTLGLMTRNHLPGGRYLSELALDGFSETTPLGVGFGLGFAMTLDGAKAGTASEGDYYWGGAASTAFWVDPREDLTVVFLTQLLPSTLYPFRGQLRALVYSAIED